MNRSKAILMALLALAFGGVEAASVTVQQVRQAARAWAKGGSGRRLGARLGTSVESAAKLTATNGVPFYAVKMSDGGTVLMSGDSDYEPILAFTAEAVDASAIAEGSPLWALLNGDLNAQKAAVDRRRSLATSSGTSAAKSPSKSRWTALLGGVDPDLATATGAAPIQKDTDVNVLDDLRVGILVKTKWGQSTLSGKNCFNYYTPGHCVCGCVATAFAQTMRYHCWPTEAVASFTEACEYKGVATNITTTGGVFDWANMPETSLSNADEEAPAIGRLTFECGVSVGMSYDMPDGSGSGAVTENVVNALTGRFGYKNAKWWSTGLTEEESVRERYIYPSLDAGCPVIFSIRGSVGGHAVVGDGYGYNTVDGVKTPYIHLNMGWTGQNDWWYNFPNIATGSNPEKFEGFDQIQGVAYDIFPEKTGRIVAGRVLDIDGTPAKGVTVQVNGLETTTSDTGVFAFIATDAELPKGTYTFTSSKGDALGMLEADVGAGGGNGDYWGYEIELKRPTVRIGETEYPTLDFAIDAAQDGDILEIFKPTELRRSRTIGVNCTIRPADDIVTKCGYAVPTNLFMAGATLTVSNGVRVLFENVVFTNAAKHVALSVLEGGTAAVKGSVGVDEIDTVDADGFELAGRIDTAFFLDCAGKNAAKDVIGRLTATEPLEGCTANIRNKYDEELGGEVSGDRLVWGAQPVPDVAAVVQLYSADGSVHTNYLSLRTLFNYVEPGTTIAIRKDCSFNQAVDVAGDLTIVAADGCAVSNLTASSFTVTDGTLSVSNVVFSGYSENGLFVVYGEDAELELEAGTRIIGQVDSAVAAYSAVSVLGGGTATLLPGCEIRGWECWQGEGGGAVYVEGGSTLNLFGGRITGCKANGYGGGVYADCNPYGELSATVNIKGDVTVKGNLATRDSGLIVPSEPDDICCYDATCQFNLTDAVTSPDGSVGVSFNKEETAGWGNAEKDSFLTVETDAQSATNSAPKFFCTIPEKDTGDTMVGVVADDGATLVWKDVGKVCPPDEADVAVIYAGEDGLTTNYYRTVDVAFEELNVKIKADATVELLKEVATNLTDIAINRSVVLRSRGAVPYRWIRNADCGITIASGNSLVVTNLTIVGDGGAGKTFGTTMLGVTGGSLTLAYGATVKNVLSGIYGVSGITVGVGGDSVRGTFTMESGAVIQSCKNTYAETPDPAVGGGLWANDAVVRLNGGTIADCRAAVGGGAYFMASCDVHISGDVRIDGNNNVFVKGASAAPNVYMVNDQISLDGAFTGSVGVYADDVTAVFGKIDAAYLASVDPADVAKGAANFFRQLSADDGSVKGCAVTNDAAALLVWSTALKEDVGGRYYEDGSGNKYYEIGYKPAPGPEYADPTPIAFKAITRVSESEWALVVTDRVQWAEYRLIWTEDLAKGFTTTGGWEQAGLGGEWTTNVLFAAPAPAAVFWKAEGQRGAVPKDE